VLELLVLELLLRERLLRGLLVRDLLVRLRRQPGGLLGNRRLLLRDVCGGVLGRAVPGRGRPRVVPRGVGMSVLGHW
jgi:hypothetical protein